MTRFSEGTHTQSDIFKDAIGVSQSESWFSARSGAPRLASIGIHIGLVGLALVPWTSSLPMRPKLNETAIALYTPSDALLKPLSLPGRTGGGGGGGKRQPTPPSRGDLPRGADKQLVPPDPEPPKNPDPKLIVPPTLVAPQLALVRPLDLFHIGDPNGVVGPPSSGPGSGRGIGDGNGHGDGDGDGPGRGKGKDGGYGGDTYSVGGNVSAPVILFRVEPEYSEEARKARYQGTVVLQAIVRRDGKVDVLQLVRSLGFGLDQNAIDALKKWRFRPAMKDGKAVDVTMNFEVTFNIR
jgi:periplasmic protein TonB